jgi:hypothetical protein
MSSVIVPDVLKGLLCLGLSQRDATLTAAVVREFDKLNDVADITRSDLNCLLAWSRLLQVSSFFHLQVPSIV